MTTLLTFLMIIFSGPLWSGLLKDFDSLGGNGDLLKRLQAQPEKGRLQIVQKRMTDRKNRLEIFSGYLQSTGGNSYLNTQSSNASMYYHITPRWSLGVQYNYFFNDLTKEGEGLLEEARQVEEVNSKSEVAIIPELNWPKSSVMGLLSYYPFYGKLSIFNSGIVHFDIYGTLGAGQILLRKGESNVYLGGVGFGLWLSQHLSARMEYNYQTYRVRYSSGERDQGINTLSFGIGILL